MSEPITCTAFPTIWGWTRTTAPFARIWGCARAWSSATSRGCISTRRKSVSASRFFLILLLDHLDDFGVLVRLGVLGKAGHAARDAQRRRDHQRHNLVPTVFHLEKPPSDWFVSIFERSARLSGRRFIVMGKRNCFAPVTFACSGGAASVRPFSPFDGDDQGGTYCFPFEKAHIRATSREKRSFFKLHMMRRYLTFLRPLSGFSSHFCNTYFRDTLSSFPPLFSNYSTVFRICESSK